MSVNDLNGASLNAYLAGKHCARRDYWHLQAAKDDVDRVACEAFAAAAESAHLAALERAVRMQQLVDTRAELRRLREQLA